MGNTMMPLTECRLSCGALKNDSFLNLRAPSAQAGLLGGTARSLGLNPKTAPLPVPVGLRPPRSSASIVLISSRRRFRKAGKTRGTRAQCCETPGLKARLGWPRAVVSRRYVS